MYQEAYNFPQIKCVTYFLEVNERRRGGVRQRKGFYLNSFLGNWQIFHGNVRFPFNVVKYGWFAFFRNIVNFRVFFSDPLTFERKTLPTKSIFFKTKSYLNFIFLHFGVNFFSTQQIVSRSWLDSLHYDNSPIYFMQTNTITLLEFLLSFKW